MKNYFKENRKFCFWVILQVIICTLLAGAIALKDTQVIEMPLDWWSSSGMVYDGEKWTLESSTVDVKKGDSVEVLSGPYIHMDKGSYTVKIGYESNRNQNLIIKAVGEDNGIGIDKTITLNKHLKELEYDFTLKKDVRELEFSIDYDGKGNLAINYITIIVNKYNTIKCFVIVLFMFLFVDICYINRKRIRENKVKIFWLGTIIMASSIPLFIEGMNCGHDYVFHLMRIEGIADGIQTGNFPVKLAPLWSDTYGYPVSVFYGDILLYFPAFLRLIGVPVVTAYKLFIFAINVMTVIVSYICFEKMYKEEKISLICTGAYMLASYRLMDVYIRAAVGEYTAMIFIPVIALALYKIYTDNPDDKKEYGKNAIVLAVGLTGLINTHILSTEMVALSVIAIALIFFKKTFRVPTLLLYIKAGLQTLVINLFFLVPFVDYYINVPVRVTNNTARIIQEHGAYVAQYFAFFHNFFGQSRVNVNERLGVTPGILLIVLLFIAIYLWVAKTEKVSKVSKLYIALSVILLYVASNLFPWDTIVRIPYIGKILTTVQFPWRYISIADMVLVMLLGQLLLEFRGYIDKQYPKLALYIVGILAVQVTCFTSNYIDDLNVTYYTDEAELDHFRMVKEYLRYGTVIDDFTYDVAGEQVEKVEIIEQRGNYMNVYCKAEENADNSFIELPKLNYKGYIAKDSNGNKLEISDGNNNVVRITVPAGFEGNIELDFCEPWYWRVAEIISLIAVVIFCIAIRKKVKTNEDIVSSTLL